MDTSRTLSPAEPPPLETGLASFLSVLFNCILFLRLGPAFPLLGCYVAAPLSLQYGTAACCGFPHLRLTFLALPSSVPSPHFHPSTILYRRSEACGLCPTTFHSATDAIVGAFSLVILNHAQAPAADLRARQA